MLPCCDTTLLPNTECAKDAVQQIVGVDCADDFSQFGKRASQFGGDEFISAVVGCDLIGSIDCRFRQTDAFAATLRGGSDRLALLRGSFGSQ